MEGVDCEIDRDLKSYLGSPALEFRQKLSGGGGEDHKIVEHRRIYSNLVSFYDTITLS